MTEAEAPRARLMLLHPALVLWVVWAIALGVWATASPAVLEASHVDGRAGSMHAFAVIFGCLGAFTVGSFVGSAWLPRRGLRGLAASPMPGLSLLATVIAAATVAGGALWLARIAMTVGGPLQLLELFRSGSSVADLKSSVYTPAQLPPFTTLVHLCPAAVSILLVQRRAGGWSGLQLALVVGVIALALTRTLVLAERLAGLATLTALVVSWLLTSDRVSRRKMTAYGVAALAALWFAWSAGEFSRSWMNKQDDAAGKLSVGHFTKSLEYSQVRLGAYIFTAVNNGILIIDNWPGADFPGNFAPGLGRLPGLQSEAGGTQLYEQNVLDREFTGESMPGSLYLDARELAVVLALAYGLIFGLAWRAAALGLPAGIVLYAALIHVLVDSYRSAYLFDIQGLAAFFAAGMVAIALLSPRRGRCRLASDTGVRCTVSYAAMASANDRQR